jgi:RND family efflux transporter MFP subunit
LGAGKDVARIVALDSIYFDAQLSETQYANIRIGQPVLVTVDALPGRTYQAAVTKIYPVASSTARSLTVRISLRNPDNSLRPQLFARGQIVLATHPNALVVPREVVLDYDGKTGRLFVVVNKKAEERKVKTGFATLAVVEILDNLQEGDNVVTVGQAQLQNGDKVEVIAASASATP